MGVELDPEKGQGSVDSPRPSIQEGISHMFSRAGEGITSAMTKAGEGIHATGTTLKDGAKSAGAAGAKAVGLGGTKMPQKEKKNPQRAKHEKKFHKSFKPIPREEPRDTNAVGNITKLLPANTFLMFQTLAPLATNDGKCHQTEIIMTSAMLIILASTCMLVCFTDTVQFNGKVYHGLVTRSGLWNPSFKGDPSLADLRIYEHNLAQFYEARRRYKSDKRDARNDGLPVPPRPVEPIKPVGPHVMGSTYSSGNSQYELNFTDMLHAVLSVMAFGTLTMLTSPVSTCFYPNIPSTVVKTLPLLVGFVISAIFAFSPPARNGIAHPLSPKVPSQLDNYKPPDPKGVVHGPSLPPKPPGNDHGKHDDDDDDLGGSVKKYLGKFLGSPERGKDGLPPEHHQLGGVKALASGFFNKYGDDIKHGAEKMVHKLEGEAMKEASHLALKAAPAVAELTKDIHVPMALQEATKLVPHDALVAGLVNAGAHPALAIAAVQSAAQGAKDAALNEIHKELHSATSGTLSGLSKQSSLALTRANSILQSQGSSLSHPSPQEALFHQAAQVLQRQASGLSPNVHAAGQEAAAIAMATGQALMHAGYQFPSYSQSPQATALNAYAQSISNQFTGNAANELKRDATSLVQQGGRSLAEVQDNLARQGASLTSHMQSISIPGSSTSFQGTLAATLEAGVAREAGTLFQEGADHGMRETITQSAASLAQDTVAKGALGVDSAKIELLKQTEVLTSQARALAVPATSVAHDLAALVTTQAAAFDPSVSAVNSQFVEMLARGVAQGMFDTGSQPIASVAIDVASLLQSGSQMHSQLASPASASSALIRRQLSLGQFQQPSVADTRMAFRDLASQLSPPTSWRDNAGLIIEDVTDAASAAQRGLDHAQRAASLLRPPSSSQVSDVLPK